MDLQIFQLVRSEDVSGVSGTGVVANGVVFPNGQAVMQWCGELNSIAIYPSIETLAQIHGHEGRTKVQFQCSATESSGFHCYGTCEAPHVCPFKSEIHGDDTLCMCCEIHTDGCAMEI